VNPHSEYNLVVGLVVGVQTAPRTAFPQHVMMVYCYDDPLLINVK